MFKSVVEAANEMSQSVRLAFLRAPDDKVDPAKPVGPDTAISAQARLYHVRAVPCRVVCADMGVEEGAIKRDATELPRVKMDFILSLIEISSI